MCNKNSNMYNNKLTKTKKWSYIKTKLKNIKKNEKKKMKMKLNKDRNYIFNEKPMI